MRILFLCGSLAKGRDGVGDYTRLLGEACAAEGATVKLIALNDVTSPEAESESACELRLSRETPWADRSAQVERAMADFEPEWMSLQFVPYAFDPRGLPLELIHVLRHVRGGAQWHVMFHETWITASRGLSWKRRATGLLQKLLVRRMLATLRPQIVHTSNTRYRDLLAGAGIESKVLPMFGAIPISGTAADEWLFSKLRGAGAQISAASRARHWLFGFFGSLYPEWDPAPLLRNVAQAAAATNRKCCFVSIGQLREGQGVWDRFASVSAGAHTFLQLGEQPGERVSALLNSLDFGVSPVPLEIIGKSASAAAMLEHGLPLLVTRLGSNVDPSRLADWQREGIYPVHETFARELAAGIPKRPPSSRLPAVAERFLQSLREKRTVASRSQVAIAH